MGVLDPFSDPRTMGILAGAGGYLANSGPSFSPVSTSSALGHGLQGAQRAMVQQQQMAQMEAYRKAQQQQMEIQNQRLMDQTALQRQQMERQAPLDQATILQRIAQWQKEQRETAAATSQGEARNKLSALVAGGGYQANTPGAAPPDAVFGNDAEAIKAVQEATARGQPFNADVPNPRNVQALAIQADPTGRLMSRMQPPNATTMTPYQQENLRLQQERLNKQPAQRLVSMPSPDDPSKAVFGVPQPGQPAFAPGTGGVLNNQLIRERQLATSIDQKIKPHLEVINAYQRFEEIRTTGDNSQANIFLAEQLKEMAARGTRALPKAELERILGSGDLGNDWFGRAANMITQMAVGKRTPAIDRTLNDLADAMAKASADRIGQELRNARAAAPSGVNLDNITGSKPRIYGRYIITPTGKVHTFANAQEAQAKLSQAERVIGRE